VFEGHTQGVDGALELEGGRILSWSQDGTLRLWSQASGIELAKLNVDTSAICVNVLANGRILFLSRSISTLMLLDESNLTILGQSELTNFEVIHYGSSLFIYALTDETQMFFWEGDILFEYVKAKGFVTLAGNVDVETSNLKIKALGAWMKHKWSSFNGWLDQYRNPSDRVWKSPIPLTSGRVLFWTMEGELRLLLPHHDISVAFEGMIDLIIGAEELMDGKILSWSKDGTLRIWKIPSEDMIDSLLLKTLFSSVDDDLLKCTELQVLSGHTAKIVGVNILIDGRILSWSEDGTLRLWDGTDGSELTVLSKHNGSVTGAKILPGGRILSWSKDGTLRLWNGTDGSELAVLRQDADSFIYNIIGAKILKDGCILSWSRYDPRLRLWDTAGSYSYSEYNEEWLSLSEVVLEDGRILSLGPDKTLRLYNVITGSIQVVMTGFPSRYLKAIELSNRRVLFWGLSKNNNLSWQNDNTLRVMNREGKIEREIITGQIGNITTIDLSNERVLSWGRDDNTLRVWDEVNGTEVAVMSHGERILWTRVLSSGRIMSCGERLVDDSQYVTLRMWDQTNGSELMVKAGYSGINELKNGCFLLHKQDDNMLKICDGTNGKELKVLSIPVEIQGIKTLMDGRILAWGGDDNNMLRVWDITNDIEITVIKIKFYIADILEDGRIVTVSTTNYIENKTQVILQSWDMKGKELATLKFTLLGDIAPVAHGLLPIQGISIEYNSIEFVRGKILMKLHKIDHCMGHYDITDMFLLWDGTENHDTLEVLQKKDLPWTAPQLLYST
jgi:WD40 repeat protein